MHSVSAVGTAVVVIPAIAVETVPVPSPAAEAAPSLVAENIPSLAAVVMTNPAVGYVPIPGPGVEADLASAPPSLVVGDIPDSVVGKPASFLLLPAPVQQGHTPLPVAIYVRNYRKTPPGETRVPRTRGRQPAPVSFQQSTMRRKQHKTYHPAAPQHRIRDKKPPPVSFQHSVCYRTQRKIPPRAGAGCHMQGKAVQPADAQYVRHSCHKTPSQLLFPVCNSGNAYNPPISRQPITIWRFTKNVK